MHLTQWTDYSLRVLMYCARFRDRDAPVTIAEIAEAYGISRSHLMKIVMTLSAAGLLETTRGRRGGIRLLRPPERIRIGDVVRLTEGDLALVECFDDGGSACALDGRCRLKTVLRRALAGFLDVLDDCTLADIVAAPTRPAGAAPDGTVRGVARVRRPARP